jgi:hypothetical protein
MKSSVLVGVSSIVLAFNTIATEVTANNSETINLQKSSEQSMSDIMPGNELILYKATNQYSGELYYPAGTPSSQIKEKNKGWTKGEAKKLIRNRIDRWWDLLIKYIPFPSREYAYAFFIGQATFESTLDPSCETAIGDWGTSSAHAYGVFQTAETAYDTPFPNWMKEPEPAEFPQAPLTKTLTEYFFDPVVSTDMGLRKSIWFSFQVKEEMITKKGFKATDPLYKFGKSPDFWMLMMKGFNTGAANFDVKRSDGSWFVDNGWWNFYGIWAPGMSQWYLKEKHLYDDANTFYYDPKINNSTYLSNPYDWLTMAVKETNIQHNYSHSQKKNIQFTHENGILNINFMEHRKGSIQIRLISPQGKVVFTKNGVISNNTMSITLNRNFSKGTYIVSVLQNSTIIVSHKINFID